MATDLVKLTMNTFVGGMDTDTNDMQMSPNKYREAHNVRLNAFGEDTGDTLTLIPGATEVLSSLVGLDLFDKGYEHDCTLWAGSIGDIGIIVSTVINGSNLCWAVQKFDKNDPDHRLELVFGPCDHKIWNDKKNNLSVVTSDEGDDVKKIYIATGIEKIMIVNVCKQYDSQSMDEVLQKNITILNPPLFKGYTQGSIKSGMVLYCYRLSTKYGAQSQLSPSTKLIPIGNFEGNKQNNDNGKPCCGVKLRVVVESASFDRILLYRIHQETFDSDPIVYKLEEASFDGDLVFVDTGDTTLPTTTLLSLYEQIDIIPSVIETKNNRLFAANVKRKTEIDTHALTILNWDSRSYQFDINGKCKMFKFDTDEYISIYIDEQAFDADSYETGTKVLLKDIKHDDYIEYCQNKHNDINVAIDDYDHGISDECQRYMRDDSDLHQGGWFYGGIGNNILWKFVITEIDGTTDIAKPWYPFINMRKEKWPSEEKPSVFKACSIPYDDSHPDEYDYDLSKIVDIDGYSGTNGTTYKDPMISYGLKSLRRDEVYRYGIVLYDERGVKYQAKWIADIRTPNIYTYDFYTFYQDDEKLKFRTLGIHFDVKLPDGCSRCEIVRCNVKSSDMSTITQCILQRPISNYKYRQKYHSSGIYTVADTAISEIDAVLMPGTFCFGVTLGRDSDPAGWSYSDFDSYPELKANINNDFKTWTHNIENDISHLCSDNKKNETLYCAASPEIVFYSQSFVDTYNSSPGLRIDTLQYIYGIGDPVYNNLATETQDAADETAVYTELEEDKHAVGHATVHYSTDPLINGKTYLNNDEFYNNYGGELFFPFGLQYRVLWDKGRASLRDSSLLIGGSHYGFTTVSQTVPWLEGFGKDLLWLAKNITDFTILSEKIKSENLSLTKHQQSIKIDDCVINYKDTNPLKFLRDTNWSYPAELRIQNLKSCCEHVACAYAYNKLINWSNYVQMIHTDGKLTYGEALSTCEISKMKQATVWNYNNVGAASQSFQANGPYTYTNYVFGASGNRIIDLYQGFKLPTYPKFTHAMIHEGSDAFANYGCGAALFTSPCMVYTVMESGRAYGHLEFMYSEFDKYKDREPYWRSLLGGINGPAGACVLLQLGKDLKRHYLEQYRNYSLLAYTHAAKINSNSKGMYPFHNYDNDHVISPELKKFANFNDHEYASMQGTYLANIKKNVSPYNGSSLSSIETSIYCSYGDIADSTNNHASITVFDGNCYIMPFEYTSLYKGGWGDKVYSKSMFNINYMIPVETNMNLYLQNGFCLSERMYDSFLQKVNSGIEFTNVTLSDHTTIYQNTFLLNVASSVSDDEISGTYKLNQEYNNYVYNSIYSSDKSNGLIYSQDLDNENVIESYRCYYSQPKERLEHVDSYTIFRMADYLDADEKYGEITAMKNFKGQMLFWLNTAMGLMSVQERVLVVDKNGGSLSLGTGGVLERYDYLSNYYGMRKNDNAVCASPSMVYWWDSNKKRIFQYQSGQNVDLLLTNKVDNMFVNSTVKNKPVISYDTKTNEVLFDVVNETNGNLVYNERATVFTSIYDVNFARSIQFDNVVYMLTDDTFDSAMVEWNKGDASFVGRELKPSVLFVVADNTHINKVYDNHEIDMIVADSIEQNNLNDIKFEYTTPLKQHASTTGADMTMREKDYRMAIPRDNDAPYGGRLRGKTMNVKITQDSSKMPFSLKYVITKYRQSLS